MRQHVMRGSIIRRALDLGRLHAVGDHRAERPDGRQRHQGRLHHRGRVVQVDPMETRVESAYGVSAWNYNVFDCFQVLLSVSTIAATPWCGRTARRAAGSPWTTTCSTAGPPLSHGRRVLRRYE
jgi:hypothetical protein